MSSSSPTLDQQQVRGVGKANDHSPDTQLGILPVSPLTPPSRFQRVGSRSTRWRVSRTFKGYEAAKQEERSIGGKASKWLLVNRQDDTDFFIAKAPGHYGTLETFTELLINQLGTSLGFAMAHSGVARLDGELYFISKNFKAADEVLATGVTMFCRELGAEVPDIEPPPTVYVLFSGLRVGELTKRDNDYVFRYRPEFLQQRLAPLPGFPEVSVEREYTSRTLFPFFAQRIPDKSRPEIDRLLVERGLTEATDLQLLGELGVHSVTDPFELELVRAA